MILPVVIMGGAFFIEACFGFGGGLVAVPILSLLIPPKDAVFLMLVFQCMKAVLLIPAWKHIQWKALRLMPLGILAGAVAGTALLDFVAPNILRILLALYLVVFVVSDMLKIHIRLSKADSTAGSLAAGFSGGVISGLIGMGGPALVTYLSALNLGKEALRATIILALTIVNYSRLALNFNIVIENATVRTYFLPCLVAFVIVLPLGARLPKLLSEKTFKLWINILLLIAAVLLLYVALTSA